MDQSTLVTNRVDDGRRFLERFAADGHPVQAGFWIKTTEEGHWFLYVVTDLYDREGPAVAYRAAHASLQKLGEPPVTSSELKVISPGNPDARAVLAVMARHPGRSPIRLSDQRLGSIAADEVYIYPARVFAQVPANSMTTDEVGHEIVRLLQRDAGNMQPAQVVLKDGTAFQGLPIALQYGLHHALVVQFVVEGEPVPRVVRLDEIASVA